MNKSEVMLTIKKIVIVHLVCANLEHTDKTSRDLLFIIYAHEITLLGSFSPVSFKMQYRYDAPNYSGSETFFFK